MLCFQVFVATQPRRSPDFFFGLPRCPTTSYSPYTLPSSVCPKPCICHSCENCRGVYQQFPFRNSQLFFLPSTNLDSGVGRSFRTAHRACLELLGVTSHPSFKSFRCNTYGSPRKCWALLTSWAQFSLQRVDKERLTVFSDGAGGTMAEVGLLPFARVALQVATQVLPPYRTRFSKHQFTQPQLLAVLCLMRYEDWTFREAEV